MIEHKLVGPAAQVAVAQLETGQTIYCEPGRLVWKTPNVAVETRLAQGRPLPAGDDLLAKAVATAVQLGRRLTGERLAFAHLTATGGSGLVAVAGGLAGQVRELRLDGGRGWRVERDAFVAAEEGVNVSPLASARREGLALLRFAGAGSLFVAGSGGLLELNPARFGGKLHVDAGRIVAVRDGVGLGLERVGALDGSERARAVRGGEGLRLAVLSGDGEVLVQPAAPSTPAKPATE